MVKYEFVSYGETVTLEKRDDIWMVLGDALEENEDEEVREVFRADEKYIDNFLNLMRDFPKGTLASRASSKWGEYGVSGKEKMLGYAGKSAILRLVIGESDVSGRQRYVRDETDDRTYLVPVSIRPVLSRRAHGWISRLPFTIEFDRIDEFIVKLDDEKRNFRFVDGTWTVVGEFGDVDDKKFEEYGKRILAWEASSIESDSSSFDAGVFRAKLFVSYDDGTETLAFNIHEKDETFYGMVENMNVVYQLDSTAIEQLKGDWFGDDGE
jgi:hypothetical protein